MNVWSIVRSLNRDQRNTFTASFLGWTLDAFDYFLLTFVTLRIAKDFNVQLPAVALTLTLTLMMRPLGALIFGLLAERFGRRTPLMIDIILYSIIELLTAFSPNYIVFLILRIIFGIAMGGEWGLGASLAMESLPTEARGLFSGILQQGYAFGYLLGAIAYFVVFTIAPTASWRIMFIIGVLPALLVVFIRARVPESPVWEHHQTLLREKGVSLWQGIWNAIKSHPILFIYLIVLMTAFNSLSHGTQDNLPTFLQAQLKLGVSATSTITIISNIGAIIGGTLFGYYSQYWGRRRTIIIACIIGLIMIPLWSGLLRIPGISVLVTIAVGAFLLQFMVQGAWGIIPVHLNELSPTDVRGTFPGFAYQLGNLFAAYIVFGETALAQNLGTAKTPNFGIALAIFSLGAFLAVIIFAAIGKEARGIDFMHSSTVEGGTSSQPEEAQA
ncbi:MFS transporter [Ktedonosporobacter rubrisoli]|uniref:MFS transporter n=1 Tax=Ktedonosporobacter rubrisoli TaxID=2509675 RepID=A0A4V0Z079_KTERU|nr:MFS transporter [Ktedonosporobacter rubrisoli]QBD82281.1 MFS transporter [Ktedonosporobacter rubrisoli]